MAFDDLALVAKDRLEQRNKNIVQSNRMFALARELMKTNTHNPVVGPTSIGHRAARVDKILAKYR
jgi:hypothetical protein